MGPPDMRWGGHVPPVPPPWLRHCLRPCWWGACHRELSHDMIGAQWCKAHGLEGHNFFHVGSSFHG